MATDNGYRKFSGEIWHLRSRDGHAAIITSKLHELKLCASVLWLRTAGKKRVNKRARNLPVVVKKNAILQDLTFTRLNFLYGTQ